MRWTAAHQKPSERNALADDNYFRNLYSLLLQEDVSAETFQRWLDGTEQPPLLSIDQLKPWFHRFDVVLVVAGLIAVAWFVRKQLKARRALS